MLLQLALALAESFKSRADFLARHEPAWKRWRLIELCALAERVGIDLGYTNPSKSRSVRDPDVRKVPHGPGIRYLIAASKFIGRPIREHYAHEVLEQFKHMKMAITTFAGKGNLIVKAGVVRPLANNTGVVIMDD